MIKVERAAAVSNGMSASATTPPEAAVTTQVTMGKSQAALRDWSVCLCFANLYMISFTLGEADRD